MSDPTPPTDPFNAGLTRMGRALRRAHAAFDEADDAFEEVMRALIVLTETRGSVTAQLTDLRETVGELQRLVLEQGQDLRALRERLNGGA